VKAAHDRQSVFATWFLSLPLKTCKMKMNFIFIIPKSKAIARHPEWYLRSAKLLGGGKRFDPENCAPPAEKGR
jgi:hypothetical protein